MLLLKVEIESFMCNYCQPLESSREREKLEYVGTRIVDYKERHYYRCVHCDQAFYWLDWCPPFYHHLEALKVSGIDLIKILEQEPS
jgi:uncharacterized protein with PIN domain